MVTGYHLRPVCTKLPKSRTHYTLFLANYHRSLPQPCDSCCQRAFGLLRTSAMVSGYWVRMSRRESNQLIIGSYFIDAEGQVRVVPMSSMSGRLTVVARHLTDPANMVYALDMEGALYELNVHSLSLEVTRLFAKPVPGWHGQQHSPSIHSLSGPNDDGVRFTLPAPRTERRRP
jgi:hypothetical protein